MHSKYLIGTLLGMGFVFAYVPMAPAQNASELERLMRSYDLQDAVQGRTDHGASRFVPSALDESEQREVIERPARRAAEVSRLERDYQQRLGHLLPPAPEPPRPRRSNPDDETSRRQIDADEPKMGTPVPQFGYDVLVGRQAGGVALNGAVDDGYIVGVGDEVVVTFRGQKNTSIRTRVDRDGRLLLPDLPPIAAKGRHFGQVRQDLEQQARAAFLQTEIFISLGSVRSIGVLVAGEVAEPGIYQLSGLSSLVDAITAAGGLRKTGALRRVEIVRGRTTIPVDLYELVLTGRLKTDITLMEGDRIVVPVLSGTYAVAGEVSRQAIYEFPRGVQGVTVEAALELSGGALRPRGYRYLKVSAASDGKDIVDQIIDPAKAVLHAGDILLVLPAADAQVGTMTIAGHVRVPGIRSLANQPSLHRLFADNLDFKPDPYLLFAVLRTVDPNNGMERNLAVDLSAVMSGATDMSLRSGDRLFVLGMDDVRFLASQRVQDVLHRKVAERRRQELRDLRYDADATAPERRDVESQGASAIDGEARSGLPKQCKSLHFLSEVVASGGGRRFSAAREPLADADTVMPGDPSCPRIFEEHPDILPFVLDHVTRVSGEVGVPGPYPIVSGTPLTSVMAVAGGLTRDANPANIELSRFVTSQSQEQFVRETIDLARGSRTVSLNPGESIRFNPLFSSRDTGPVHLSGEFRIPGQYAIHRGERLSEVVARAGGITDQAYPLGLILLRESAKEEERKAFERMARDLEAGVTYAATQATGRSFDPSAVVALKAMVEQLRKTEPVGRVVVEGDPVLLQVRPELDTILQPGDRIVLPKRPNSIAVTGEVLNPGTLQFRSGFGADDYIDMAGGATRAADKGRAFAVLPNGTARPLRMASWHFTEERLPPGSTIVVPRDPAPFSLRGMFMDTAEVLSKIAVTAASLAVISTR